ncbi:MAG: hypothetical protein HN509_00185 [Halobacteriovoraceae bacterium]|jgi:hypothetical protein|nr:hypothetical protein [Halobacteriovoraceae bacterium]MBT5095114.1 hypothetical protein [Halobacteriovoraceae bacterium]
MENIKSELQSSIDAITKKAGEGLTLEAEDLEILFLATFIDEEQRERAKS